MYGSDGNRQIEFPIRTKRESIEYNGDKVRRAENAALLEGGIYWIVISEKIPIVIEIEHGIILAGVRIEVNN